MRRKFVIFAVLLTVALSGGGFLALRQERAVGASLPAATAGVPVVASTVISRKVPVYLRGVGTVIAYNTVQIHSQITGVLTRIAFTEGQSVKAGDLLA